MESRNTSNNHSHEFHVSNTTTFPQPTRPINSYYLDLPPVELPKASHPNNMTFLPSIPEKRGPVLHQVPYEAATHLKAEEGDKETIEELLRAILELYARLPASIRSQVKLDKFNVPISLTKDLKFNGTTSTSREIQGSMEELSNKLERFKIRTIKLGGVVKQEDMSP